MARSGTSSSGSSSSTSHGHDLRPQPTTTHRTPTGPDPRVPHQAPPPSHQQPPPPHQQPQHPSAEPPGRTPPAEGADDGGGADGGGGGPEDPRAGWFGGKMRDLGGSAIDSLGGRGIDWAGDKLFGPSNPEDPEGTGSRQPGGGEGPSAGPEDGANGFFDVGGLVDRAREPGAGQVGSEGMGAGTGVGLAVGAVAGEFAGQMQGGRLGTTMPAPYGSATGGASDAYEWARAQVAQAMEALPEAQHASRGGLGGALDEAVEWALEKSGLLEMLEKVTGNLAELNSATMEWQAQAAAVRSVAAEVRAGALPLAETWEGSASDAFGGHMGEVADALDQTAEEMMQTAQVISSAAQECAMAEGMVIEIISEAIESLIVSLAAEAVLAVITLGIGAIVDVLISEAEIATFVARVARVSTKLAEALEKLLKALKEMNSAVKATRKLNDVRNVMTKMKEVKTAFNEVRALEEGESRAAKVAKAIDDKVTEKATEWGEEQLKGALGIDEDDGVQRGDGTLKGSLKAAGQSALGAAKEGWKSEVNQDAVKQELLHDVGLAQDPEPYRVDNSRIRTAFG